MKLKPANGYILWEGVSPIDGAPIVCIATGFKNKSANAKTGDEIQTWILRADVEPHVAVKLGLDAAICGDCPHRPANNGTCYVKTFQAPLSVFRKYKTGGYRRLPSLDLFNGRAVRLGSYGDPAMVPAEVWREIVAFAADHTGYTHQWRSGLANGLKGIVQASCDSLADFLDATAAGWKTFLVKPANAPDPVGTVHCAASVERGQKTNCATCTLCDGASANVVINAHGATAGRHTWEA